MANNLNFDNYLDGLVDEEKRKKEIASENYNEWKYHFDLLKQNFREIYDMFGTIEKKVPFWSRVPMRRDFTSGTWSELEYIGLAFDNRDNGNWGRPVVSSKTGYIFNAELAKRNPKDPEIYSGIKVAYGDYRNGIGDEICLLKEDSSKLPEKELYGLSKIQKAGLLTPSNTKKLLENFDSLKLEFKVEWGKITGRGWDNVLGAGVKLDIGFLYGHSLADVCQELFMAINSRDVSEQAIKDILHEGENLAGNYSRRPMPADDNTITHAEDTQWRNG
jgi:hypothetical protein